MITLPFTAGQSAWIIIGVAALAGAAGGLAGAAIEKSNLARGAINGGIIGAAVGVGGVQAGAGGGGGGASGAGGGSSSVSITSSSGIEGSTIIEITGVAEAVGTTGTSEVGKNVLFNSIKQGIVVGGALGESGSSSQSSGQAGNNTGATFSSAIGQILDRHAGTRGGGMNFPSGGNAAFGGPNGGTVGVVAAEFLTTQVSVNGSVTAGNAVFAAKQGAVKSPKGFKFFKTLGGIFHFFRKIKPGRGGGQSRAEFIIVKNNQGRTIRTFKDSFDRAGKFQHRKPLSGGPEGRQ